MNWKVQLFKLNFDEKEAEAAKKVVSKGWLSMGEKTSEFETKFSNFLGKNTFSTAVSSCTAGLHIALLALGVKEDDEVIIPSLTFVADANVVNLVGANPVLADCDSLENWNVSLTSLKQKVTKKTKAIIIVHYAGYPCKDIELISEFCKKRGIYLIEDVAHAPGAKVNGKSCGTFGDINCFSFYSNKNLSVGEGGMVTTLDKDLNKRVISLRTHGMTTNLLDRHKGRALSYDVDSSGLNYRIDEIRSAIGIIQLQKLSSSNEQRGELTDLYRSNLKSSCVTVPFESQQDTLKSAFHILPILLPEDVNRLDVINFLKKEGIQTSIHYPPFWDFSVYKEKFYPEDYPISKIICKNQLTLPLYPNMTKNEVNFVTSKLLEAFR